MPSPVRKSSRPEVEAEDKGDKFKKQCQETEEALSHYSIPITDFVEHFHGYHTSHLQRYRSYTKHQTQRGIRKYSNNNPTNNGIIVEEMVERHYYRWRTQVCTGRAPIDRKSKKCLDLQKFPSEQRRTEQSNLIYRDAAEFDQESRLMDLNLDRSKRIDDILTGSQTAEQ
ncbi:uncharacterized protein LOC129739426 [Uranotaenia lowii]|uniref:uncharacterized protein LOC129739426 n=1 Tax=Uranotaenia lowii TaxID=190385 RepID=UPI00247855E5|nr:uncharacterized protein LOC129739426 [Uranotaenia lowii]